MSSHNYKGQPCQLFTRRKINFVNFTNQPTNPTRSCMHIHIIIYTCEDSVLPTDDKVLSRRFPYIFAAASLSSAVTTLSSRYSSRNRWLITNCLKNHEQRLAYMKIKCAKTFCTFIDGNAVEAGLFVWKLFNTKIYRMKYHGNELFTIYSQVIGI